MNIENNKVQNIDLTKEKFMINQHLGVIAQLIERVSEEEKVLFGRLLDLKLKGMSPQVFEQLLSETDTS